MFRFAQVEAAIAKLHDLPADSMKTLRARIRHYQKIGIIPSAPGIGKKISYTPELAVAWALCTELSEAAVPPNFVRLLLNNHGYGFMGFFVGDKQHDEDVYLFIKGQFMRNQIMGTENYYTIGYGNLANAVIKFGRDKEMLRRCTLINMSDFKRRLGEALDIKWAEVVWERPENGWLYPPQAGDIDTH